MQRGDTISPEVLALPPGDDSDGLPEQLLLERAAGYTNTQLALTHGIDESTIDDLIRSAIDDRLLGEIRQEVRDHLILKSFEIDQELKMMYQRLPDTVQRHYQSCTKDRDGKATAVDLVEDWSNIAGKTNILKERRQLILTQKVLLQADTDDRGHGERDGDMRSIIGTIGDIAKQVIGDSNKLLAQQAREAGRLEAGQTLPASDVEEEVIDGNTE